jgi:hypothetical protein
MNLKQICLEEVFDPRSRGTRPLLVVTSPAVGGSEMKWRKRVYMLCSVEIVVGDRRRHCPVATPSPRHPSFTSQVLEPLSLRHSAGESDRALSMELYNLVHPWAVSFAAAQSAGLPAHADRNEVLSQVLRLTWEACLRIDWERYAAWPTFLETKISRARIEAARCDDWLSRRERVRRRRFQGELARREQVEQRSLTDCERQAVAVAVAPSSTRVDWAKTLLDSRHPSTVAEVPDSIQGTSDEAITIEDQVEGRELGGIRVRCLTEWLVIVAAQNQGLATDLSRWSELNQSADRDLPARLAHRLEPYTHLLLAMLGDAA